MSSKSSKAARRAAFGEGREAQRSPETPCSERSVILFSRPEREYAAGLSLGLKAEREAKVRAAGVSAQARDHELAVRLCAGPLARVASERVAMSTLKGAEAAQKRAALKEAEDGLRAVEVFWGLSPREIRERAAHWAAKANAAVQAAAAFRARVARETAEAAKAAAEVERAEKSRNQKAASEAAEKARKARLQAAWAKARQPEIEAAEFVLRNLKKVEAFIQGRCMPWEEDLAVRAIEVWAALDARSEMGRAEEVLQAVRSGAVVKLA